jgi:hypothetical protein
MCTPCATRRSLQTLPFLKLLPCPPARRHCCLDVHVRRKAPTKPRQTRLPCACPSHTTAQHLEIMPWHVEFLYTLSVRCGDGAPSMCPGERTCVQRPSYLLTFITVQRASTTLLTDTGMTYTPSRPHATLPRRRCCCCLVRPCTFACGSERLSLGLSCEKTEHPQDAQRGVRCPTPANLHAGSARRPRDAGLSHTVQRDCARTIQ